MSALSKTELEMVLKLTSSLNHYQLLKIKPAASEDEVREAFHREAIIFHPDQYFQEDAEIREHAKQIYTRLVEAYRTLVDTQKRREYDRLVLKTSGGTKTGTSGPIGLGNRIEDIEGMDTGSRKRAGPSQSAPANRFFKLAQTALQSRNYPAALMNIKIAINADPENPLLQDFLSRVEAESQKRK